MPHVFDIRKREKLWSEERFRRQPIPILMEWLQPKQGEHWLDIGAGNGYVTIPLLQRGCLVSALDSEEAMISDLISRVPAGLESGLVTIVAKAPPLPLKDGTVDAVLMVNTLHEIDDLVSLVKEISRALVSKGRVHIVEHRKDHDEDGPPKDDRLGPEDVAEIFVGFKVESKEIRGVFHHTCLSL